MVVQKIFYFHTFSIDKAHTFQVRSVVTLSMVNTSLKDVFICLLAWMEQSVIVTHQITHYTRT